MKAKQVASLIGITAIVATLGSNNVPVRAEEATEISSEVQFDSEGNIVVDSDTDTSSIDTNSYSMYGQSDVYGPKPSTADDIAMVVTDATLAALVGITGVALYKTAKHSDKKKGNKK
jgi:hypothetical protein